MKVGVLIICKVVIDGPRDQFKEASGFDFEMWLSYEVVMLM